MTVSDIGALISSYGFPIVACVAIAWFCYQQISAQKEQNEKHTAEIMQLNKNSWEQIMALNEKHEAEVTKMTEAVNNNTLALQRLCERMGGIDNEN